MQVKHCPAVGHVERGPTCKIHDQHEHMPDEAELAEGVKHGQPEDGLEAAPRKGKSGHRGPAKAS